MSALTAEQHERIRAWGELLLDQTFDLHRAETTAGSVLASVLTGVTTLESTNWVDVLLRLEAWERAHPEHVSERLLSEGLRAILGTSAPMPRAAL